jgi:hypothetical protein
MVARAASSNGVVFVDLKTARQGGDGLQAFASAFDIHVDRVEDALPRALMQFREKHGRFATVIIADAQGMVGSVQGLLQRLAQCAEAKAAKLVFLSSEGDLAGQLRAMSGWSNAVRDYQLDPITEATMQKHLVDVWRLEPGLAASIVERIGSGTRDIFEGVLSGYTPGSPVDAAAADVNVGKVIGEARSSIRAVMDRLHNEELSKTAGLEGVQRAAVLLLDRLLTMPVTRPHDASMAAGQRPSVSHFTYARRVLVESNILRTAKIGEVMWHRRPLRTAYAELKDTATYRAIREGRAAEAAEAAARA